MPGGVTGQRDHLCDGVPNFDLVAVLDADGNAGNPVSLGLRPNHFAIVIFLHVEIAADLVGVVVGAKHFTQPPV